MITCINGNIVDATENVICHQVNCKGVMGKGVASHIKSRYPRAFIEYKDFCDEFPSVKDLVGRTQIVAVGFNKYIANMFSQESYRPTHDDDNILYTDYSAFTSAFDSVCSFCKRHDLTLAIPYNIGCGLGGGNWNIVLTIIEKTLTKYELDATMYVYKTK